MRNQRSIAALLLSVALLSQPCAYATTVVPATAADLVAAASSVFVGTVTAAESRWVGKKILTFNTISVSRVVKGSPGDTITVTTLGGAVGAIAQSVPGSPELSVGQEVLLFSAPKSGHNLVVYFNQGYFNVLTENGSKYVQVHPQSLGLSLTADDHGRVPLDDFIGAVTAQQ